MKFLILLVLVHVVVGQYGGGGGYGKGGGGGEGGSGMRQHIKLNLGIHVPPIVLKMPRIQMPKMTIKANFIKQPYAKPLELALPPPPSITFGDSGGYGKGYGPPPDANLHKVIKVEGGGGGGGKYGGGGGGGGGYPAPPPPYGGMDHSSGHYAASAPQPNSLSNLPYLEAKTTAASKNVAAKVEAPAAPAPPGYMPFGEQAPMMLPPPPPFGMPPFMPPMYPGAEMYALPFAPQPESAPTASQPAAPQPVAPQLHYSAPQYQQQPAYVPQPGYQSPVVNYQPQPTLGYAPQPNYQPAPESGYAPQPAPPAQQPSNTYQPAPQQQQPAQLYQPPAYAQPSHQPHYQPQPQAQYAPVPNYGPPTAAYH